MTTSALQPPADPLAYVDEERPVVRTGWEPTSIADLDWCLERMGHLDAEAREVNALAEEAERRIAFRREKLIERITRGRAFFSAVAAAYAESHREELIGGGKRKSRALIFGTVGWAKKRGGLEVRDEAAALEWARKQPVELGVLRITEELSRIALAAHFERTGEVPPGCELKDEGDTLRITPAERPVLPPGKEH